jgi:4-hydroxybenzoate polyprenyltransferase
MSSDNSFRFMNSVKLLFLSRKSMAFIFSWTAAIGTIIAGRGLPPMVPTLLAIGASMCIALSVYLYNDVVDRELDAASPNKEKQERPLASGVVPVSHAMNFIYILVVTGLTLSYLVSMTTFIIGLTFFVLLALYSFPAVRFKRMFIVKTLITSTGPSWATLLGGNAASGTFPESLVYAAVIQAALMFFVLPGLADSFDIDEDRAFGIKTLAMALNWTQKVHMMVVSVFLVATASIIGYRLIGFNLVLPVAVILFSVILLREIVGLYKGYDEAMAKRTRKVTYAYFTFLPVFMAVGTFDLATIL